MPRHSQPDKIKKPPKAPKGGATIKDVAQLAQVSIATVSRVVNRQGNVSDELCRQVEEAIEALNYIPNSVARSLKTKRTKTIGLVIGNLYLPFYASIVHYLERNLRQKGYGLIISCHHDIAEMEGKCLGEMLLAQVDAIIITPTNANDHALAQTAASGIPVLLIDRISQHKSLPYICTDKQEGFYLLSKAFYDKGHRRLAIITGTHEIASNQHRYQGFLRFLKETGIPESQVFARAGAFVGTEDYGYAAGQELLSLHRHSRPTGILLGNIALTYGFLRSCLEAGLQVPGDISLACLGNFYNPHVVPVKLTYMDEQPQEIGVLGAQMVHQMLTEPQREIVSRLLPAQIFYGESIGQPKL